MKCRNILIGGNAKWTDVQLEQKACALVAVNKKQFVTYLLGKPRLITIASIELKTTVERRNKSRLIILKGEPHHVAIAPENAGVADLFLGEFAALETAQLNFSDLNLIDFYDFSLI